MNTSQQSQPTQPTLTRTIEQIQSDRRARQAALRQQAAVAQNTPTAQPSTVPIVVSPKKRPARRLTNAKLLIIALALLFGIPLCLYLGFKIYMTTGSKIPFITDTPANTPFFLNGQTVQDGDIPLQGFITSTPANIPLEGFQPSGGEGPNPINTGDIIMLSYPGGPGLYNWIYQQLGYSHTDAGDPNGSFVCVYKKDIREKGIEDQWKLNTKQSLVIFISQQDIESCGGVK